MRYERVAMLGVVATLAVWAVTCKAGDGPPPPPGGPPSVDAGVDMRAETGRTTSFTARVTLPQGATASAYHWTVTWGDGAADSGTLASTGQVAASHTYAATGQYTLRLAARGPATADTSWDTITAQVDAPGTPQTLIGAGDIGECTFGWPQKTAQVIEPTPGTVFNLGDNAYPFGRAEDYAACYNATWGRFKKRTYPAPGNHDYQEYGPPNPGVDTTADGYFGYFGVAAHQQPMGIYSYDLGAWHIVVLNSSFEEKVILGRVLDTTAQLSWLDADLAAHPSLCTLAIWHHPRFSSGTVHGSDARLTSFWQHLYNAGADVVLSGHEHNYERFAPQTPDGVADPAHGIREFVVGTGGGGYDPLDTTKLGQAGNSEVGGVDHGVLKLTLSPGSYHWEFIPVGYTLPLDQTPSQYSHTDSGTALCH